MPFSISFNQRRWRPPWTLLWAVPEWWKTLEPCSVLLTPAICVTFHALHVIDDYGWGPTRSARTSTMWAALFGHAHWARNLFTTWTWSLAAISFVFFRSLSFFFLLGSFRRRWLPKSMTWTIYMTNIFEACLCQGMPERKKKPSWYKGNKITVKTLTKRKTSS